MEDAFFFSEKEAEGCFDGEMSPSDLEKLEVEEDMAEVPRADMLLRTGLKQQKISVLMSMHKVLAASNTKETLIMLLDAIKHLWKKSEAENDAELLNEIFTCLQCLPSVTADGKILIYPMTTLFEEFDEKLKQYNEEKETAVFLLTEEQVTKQILPLVLDLVHDLQQKDYAECASQSIAATIPRIAGSLKKTQIIRIGIEKGDVSQGAGSRLICCLILGVLTASSLLSEQDIEGLFFQKMMALCQDTDAEVRKCMCMQLDALARAIGQAKASNELLPELLELLQDEEEQVKIMAFRTLLSLYDFFPKKERVDSIVPVLIDIIEAPPTYLLESLATQFGRLVYKLYTLEDFTSETAATFQLCFNRLCRNEDPSIRLACAYNFPAVVKSFGANQYSSQLDELLQAFTQDSCEDVRMTIVSGIHEVANLLGQQRAQRYIKNTSLNIFKDESPAVQGLLIARLPDLMQYFCTSVDDDQKTANVDTILKGILQHHTILATGRWREQLHVVSALDRLPAFVSPSQLYERVCPLLFELMNSGAHPIQLEAVRVLVSVNRENKVSANRVSVLIRLRKEYALGKSYWQRMLYLDACTFAANYYSRNYFRQNFLDPAIDLLEDPIPNVRNKAYTLLPRWKPSLIVLHANDEKVISRIRGLLELTQETDRDVNHTIHEVRDHWHHDAVKENDTDDQKKSQAEAAANLTSDHEMYSSEAKWSEMLEYTLIVGKDGQVVRRARVKSIDIINKLRQHSKDTHPRGSASSVLSTRSNTNPKSVNLDSREKAMTKLPSPSPAVRPGISSSSSSLPTCAPATTLPLSSSSTTSKLPGSSGSLSARDSKDRTIATSSSTLKQITDSKASGRSTPNKASVASNTSAPRVSKEKKDDTMTKIPNIPVPTRPIAPSAKRVQSPSATKSTTGNSTRTASSGASNARVTPLAKR